MDSDRLTVPGHVSFVRRVLDALGWASATVHGNSMGGLIATHLAAKHPEVVDRLVLVSPALPHSCALRLLPPSVPAVQGMLTMGLPSISGTVLAAATGRDARPAARALLGARSGGGRPQLTAREVEVLTLVRDGLANKQIARQLEISERTVKAHLTSAFSRIGVTDRTQAALWAQRNGL